METVDNRTLKEKFRDGFKKAKYKVEDIWTGAKRTVSEHKKEAFVLTALLGPGILNLITAGLKSHRSEKERRRDECDYYDPRTGEHWYTRSPLTSGQKLELELRYNNGESKGHILRSMHKL